MAFVCGCMKSNCTLHDFMAFLKFSCGFSFDINRHTFGERIKLQKYVFMATKMGLSPSLPLDYSMYIRGPYSSTLADIYFNSVEWEKPIFDTKEFDATKFVSTLEDKDAYWLEVASTIVYVIYHSLAHYERDLGKEDVMARVRQLKDYDKQDIEMIYDSLKMYDLI